MEARVIVTTELQLKAIVADAVSAAFKYYQPTPLPTSVKSSNQVSFSDLLEEYYPGIPVSTVRQDTAKLSRTKTGRRILFDRAEVEEHLRQKRRPSASEMAQQADAQFTSQHRSRGGQKAA